MRTQGDLQPSFIRYNRLLKCFLALSLVFLSTAALAFGGSGSGRHSNMYGEGVKAIGVHFGGDGQANFDVLPSCSDHGYWDTTHSACVCDDGYLPNETECIPDCGNYAVWMDGECKCIEGYTRSGGICKACFKGSYKALIGNENCFYCPTGTYADTNGATSCKDCNGACQYTPDGVSCQSCSPGQKPNSSRTSCINAEVGDTTCGCEYGADGAGGCQCTLDEHCGEGKHCSAGVCCPVGKISFCQRKNTEDKCINWDYMNPDDQLSDWATVEGHSFHRVACPPTATIFCEFAVNWDGGHQCYDYNCCSKSHVVDAITDHLDEKGGSSGSCTD